MDKIKSKQKPRSQGKEKPAAEVAPPGKPYQCLVNRYYRCIDWHVCINCERDSTNENTMEGGRMMNKQVVLFYFFPSRRCWRWREIEERCREMVEAVGLYAWGWASRHLTLWHVSVGNPPCPEMSGKNLVSSSKSLLKTDFYRIGFLLWLYQMISSCVHLFFFASFFYDLFLL